MKANFSDVKSGGSHIKTFKNPNVNKVNQKTKKLTERLRERLKQSLSQKPE